MTRDELILAALGAGDATTAVLVRSTGVTERSCRYGLRHLIAVGYAWSPKRGLWRLTEAGRAIASELPGLPAGRADTQSTALPFGRGGTATAAEAAGLSSPPEDPSGMPASLGWALAGVAAVVVLALARRLPTSPPPPPSAPPTVWPYDGWRI